MNDLLYNTAVHEAGHSVIHHILGSTVREASVIPEEPGERGFIYVMHDYRDSRNLRELIVGSCAGYWATCEFLGYSNLPASEGDLENIYEYLSVAKELLGDGLNERALSLTSRILVIENRERIEEFAEILLDRQKLVEPEITEILNKIAGARYVGDFPSPLLRRAQAKVGSLYRPLATDIFWAPASETDGRTTLRKTKPGAKTKRSPQQPGPRRTDWPF